jgi:hypothetical protein
MCAILVVEIKGRHGGAMSVINEIYGRMNSTDNIEVGTGATVLFYSDRAAATVVEVHTNPKGEVNRVGIKYDNAVRTDNNGMSDAQSYRYEAGEGPTIYFTKRKNGAFVREGDQMRSGQKVLIGKRDHYHDYSF